MDHKFSFSKPTASPSFGSSVLKTCDPSKNSVQSYAGTKIHQPHPAKTHSALLNPANTTMLTLLELPPKFPSISPIDESALLKAPMIDTPPNPVWTPTFDPRFNASNLSIEVCDRLLEDFIMTAPTFGRTKLCHTPVPKRKPKESAATSTLAETEWRVASATCPFPPTLDDFDLLICHPDFPHLVALAKRVREVKVGVPESLLARPSTYLPPDIIGHVNRIKERLPYQGIVIARQQHPRADRTIQDCFAILLHELESTTTLMSHSNTIRQGSSDTAFCGIKSPPSPLFTPSPPVLRRHAGASTDSSSSNSIDIEPKPSASFTVPMRPPTSSLRNKRPLDMTIGLLSPRPPRRPRIAKSATAGRQGNRRPSTDTKSIVGYSHHNNNTTTSSTNTLLWTPPPCHNSNGKRRPFSAFCMTNRGHLSPCYDPVSELSCRSRCSFRPSLDSVPEMALVDNDSVRNVEKVLFPADVDGKETSLIDHHNRQSATSVPAPKGEKENLSP